MAQAEWVKDDKICNPITCKIVLVSGGFIKCRKCSSSIGVQRGIVNCPSKYWVCSNCFPYRCSLYPSEAEAENTEHPTGEIIWLVPKQR